MTSQLIQVCENTLLEVCVCDGLLFLCTGREGGDDHAESSPVQNPRLVPQQAEGR